MFFLHIGTVMTKFVSSRRKMQYKKLLNGQFSWQVDNIRKMKSSLLKYSGYLQEKAQVEKPISAFSA